MYSDMMKLGSSVHWEEALYAISGTRDLSAEPIVEYFQPLLDWLDEQNTDLNLNIGWDETSCPPGIILGNNLGFSACSVHVDYHHCADIFCICVCYFMLIYIFRIVRRKCAETNRKT